MVSSRALIVGAGQAGLQVAVSLREEGHEGPITLVGEEPYLPYQRPPLSKGYLQGKVGTDSLSLRNEAFFITNKIELLRQEHVSSVDLGAGLAVSTTGDTLGFDLLALTTGASPRRLEVPGSDLHGVCYVRDIHDADALSSALTNARSVVVIGGGFVGLEAAAVCRDAGKAVTVVEAQQRVLGRTVAPAISDFYLAAHQRRGTEFRLGLSVAGFDGANGNVAKVYLSDGTVLQADLVIIGVGAAPRIELAEQMGLRTSNGAIVVDRYAVTSDPHVVAAGDCTIMPNPRTGSALLRLESVQNAVDQAKVAAAAMIGKPRPYDSVPWFWSDQYDLKLQIAGLSEGHDEVVLRGDPDTEHFSALYFAEGRLIAIDAVNRPADYVVVRRLLAQGGNIPPDGAADVSAPLKDLVAAS